MVDPSLIDLLGQSFIESFFSTKSLKYQKYETIRARELTFLHNVHHLSHVMCRVSCVTCHVSCVMWPMRGRDLVLWSEGQWEASKKTAHNGADRQTDRRTLRRTWRLLDHLGPEGRVGENTILGNLTFYRKYQMGGISRSMVCHLRIAKPSLDLSLNIRKFSLCLESFILFLTYLVMPGLSYKCCHYFHLLNHLSLSSKSLEHLCPSHPNRKR